MCVGCGIYGVGMSGGCRRILRKGENAGTVCGKPRMRWGVGRNSHLCNWCWHCNQTRRLNKCRDGGSNRRVVRKCGMKKAGKDEVSRVELYGEYGGIEIVGVKEVVSAGIGSALCLQPERICQSGAEVDVTIPSEQVADKKEITEVVAMENVKEVMDMKEWRVYRSVSVGVWGTESEYKCLHSSV